MSARGNNGNGGGGREETALAVRTASRVQAYLEHNRDAILRSMPPGYNYDRFCRVIVNAIHADANLATCTPASLFLSAVAAFSIGLEPCGPTQEAYLIPYNNRKKSPDGRDRWVKEAQFMPSYRGLINLARRSGEVASIYAVEVCAADYFEVVQGTDRRIEHRPVPFGDRGEVIGWYAVVRFTSGEVDFELIDREEMEKIRNAGMRNGKTNDSPAWNQWYNEMARKSVLKRLLKRCPMRAADRDLARAILADHAASQGTAPDRAVTDTPGMEDVVDAMLADDDAEASESAAAVNRERLGELRGRFGGNGGNGDDPGAGDDDPTEPQEGDDEFLAGLKAEAKKQHVQGHAR